MLSARRRRLKVGVSWAVGRNLDMHAPAIADVIKTIIARVLRLFGFGWRYAYEVDRRCPNF